MGINYQLLLFVSVFFIIDRTKAYGEESTEQLYRRTVQNWRTQRTWSPWKEYSSDLSTRWDDSLEQQNQQQRLEIVGGFEEGILAIERATVARGDGEDMERDSVLSQLYCAYGKALMELTDIECHSLARDPHTLLIGVEKLTKEPSNYLCVENAENALRNAATLDATNTKAESFLKKITGSQSVHERKPKEFVAELFDSFADTFDEKLVDGLKYTVPQLVGNAAKNIRPIYNNILDAGCGTGLAGRYLKSLLVQEEGVMIGVDASQKMLDIAEKCTTLKGCGIKSSESKEGGKALYDNLLVLDLEEMTIENTINLDSSSQKREGFDLIVAADVLVYFGSITNLLKTFASISVQGAVLIFSCERATEEEAPLGWRLLSSGRFSHTKKHALEASSKAGYDLVTYEEIVPRMEKGEEVKGHMFGFVLKGNDVSKHVEL